FRNNSGMAAHVRSQYFGHETLKSTSLLRAFRVLPVSGFSRFPLLRQSIRAGILPQLQHLNGAAVLRIPFRVQQTDAVARGDIENSKQMLSARMQGCDHSKAF